MKRITPTTTPTPDKTGSRAASTAQIPKLLVAWRKRYGLTRAIAADIFCCSERTLENWEQARSAPRGFSLRCVMLMLDDGVRLRAEMVSPELRAAIDRIIAESRIGGAR